MTDATSRSAKQNTTREDAFLTALLSGQGISAACQTAGISRSTGLRLRQNPSFEQRFREARRDLLTATLSKLHTDSMDHVDTLHSISIDEHARGSDRVLAARHALDLLLRGTETMELAARIEKLEQVTNETGNAPDDTGLVGGDD